MGFMNIHETIKFLDKQIPNPSLGLPEEVFLFISRITLMGKCCSPYKR